MYGPETSYFVSNNEYPPTGTRTSVKSRATATCFRLSIEPRAPNPILFKISPAVRRSSTSVKVASSCCKQRNNTLQTCSNKNSYLTHSDVWGQVVEQQTSSFKCRRRTNSSCHRRVALKQLDIWCQQKLLKYTRLFNTTQRTIRRTYPRI